MKRAKVDDRIAASCEPGTNQFAEETDAQKGHGGRVCSVDLLKYRRIAENLVAPNCASLTGFSPTSFQE